jgi:hypothetical protein
VIAGHPDHGVAEVDDGVVDGEVEVDVGLVDGVVSGDSVSGPV